MAVVFVARYRSTCDHCGDHIQPGDDCTWSDDQPVHADCTDRTTPPTVWETTPCSGCWQVPARNGICGCD